MKTVIVLTALVAAASGQYAMDQLMDYWINNYMRRINSTNDRYVVPGFEVESSCNAFVSDIACNASLPSGIVKNIASFSRYNSVVTSQGSDGVTASFQVAFNGISLEQPNLIVSGDGILVEYKGISTRPQNQLVANVKVKMIYYTQIDNCKNSISVTLPSETDLKGVTYIDHPKIELVVNNNFTQAIMRTLISSVKQFLTSIVAYENPCLTFGNFFQSK